MKFCKWLSLLLAVIMMLSLCACGGKNKDDSTPDTTTAATTTTTTEATTEATTTESTTTTEETTTTTTKSTTKVTAASQKPNIPSRPAVKGVENILLFGLDERGEIGKTKDETGKKKSYRSDSIIVLSIDRRDPSNPRIKMSALARDTLVYIEGYNSAGSKSKLNAAFQHGYTVAKNADKKGKKTEEDYKHAGAQKAMETINENFGLNISNYIFLGFSEFIEVIDYLGGVSVNVEEKVLEELNKHIKSANAECGLSVKQLSSAGKQTLNGGQTLAYCRVRKIDSDLRRTERQRKVLKALYNQVKSSSADKVVGMIGKLTKICHTNMSTDELVELATWAFSNKPSFENLTLPNGACNSWGGSHSTYGWVFIYDLNYAAAVLYDFIYDTNEVANVSKPTKYRG